MGVTAYAVRVLSEGEWNGGKGKSMTEVMRMTPDQVWLNLCEMDLLKQPVGKRRASMSSTAAAGRISRAEVDGAASVAVRASGKSKASQLSEQAKRSPAEMRADLEAVGMPEGTIDRMVAARELEIEKAARKRRRKQRGVV